MTTTAKQDAVCSTCNRSGAFDPDHEFVDETGFVCRWCGSNNYYPEAEPFPVDYDVFRAKWHAWYDQHQRNLRPTRDRFPGVNILADERLGTWVINGKLTELSALTMPDFGKRNGDRVRYIGITYKIGADGESDLVSSFTELTEKLGLD